MKVSYLINHFLIHKKKLLLIFLDFLFLLSSIFISHRILEYPKFGIIPSADFDTWIWFIGFAFVLQFVIFYIADLYLIPNTHTELLEQKTLILGLSLAVIFAGTAVFCYWTKFPLGRDVILLSLLLSWLGLLAERLSILQVFSPKHFALVKLINCAFLSQSQLAEELIKQNSFQNKYKAIFLSVNSVTELESLIKDQGIRIIVIDASSDLKSQNQLLINCLTKLKFEGIQVIALENFFEKITSRIPLLHIPGNWFLNSQVFNEISNQAILRSKRLFDIVLTLILSPLALLLIFISALIIRLTSKGAALYKQSRVGQGGKLFDVFKLRSMYVDAEKDGIQWTQENDTRITPFGKIIRATRIDELPQLWNILQGDMSFIGPRPERPEFVEKLKEDIPYYDLRHSIRPGLTGWAQINEPLATPSDALEKLEYDLFYIRNLSLWLEADIILKTIRVVLMRQGR